MPPRRFRRKRPPKNSKGKSRLPTTEPTPWSGSCVGGWTANCTECLRSAARISGPSLGRISTRWRPPSASTATSALPASSKVTRSTESFSTASRNSDKAHGPTGAADAEVARLAAITPIAPASERRVLVALMRVAARARGIARGAANERGALARKACTSTLARRRAHPTVRAAERGIVSLPVGCVQRLGVRRTAVRARC